ncbi:MAG: hypothetical protein ACLTTH_09640 [Holdemanella porci]
MSQVKDLCIFDEIYVFKRLAKRREIYSECLDDFFDLNVSLPNDYTEFKTDEKI